MSWMYYSLDILALVFSSLATPQKCHRARIPNTMKVCAVSLANDPMTIIDHALRLSASIVLTACATKEPTDV
ncbi:uncharacterized protein METZ01_LOCUS513771 [marine metagenome]|uniref:Uncharacterized protein n=1 Tax=marine metagenome TaxID=408172 RepID=A0A383EVK9_9ZZZZ